MPNSDPALLAFLRERFPEGYGRFHEVADQVGRWLEYVPATFPHYTSHTAAHSQTIIERLSKILFHEGADTPVIQLTGAETYVLAVSAYLHDAGMVVPEAEKAQILTSREWEDWVAPGGPGHSRFDTIEAYRSGQTPGDESTFRSYVADRQLRFLIGEFTRRSHHERSRRLANELHAEFGGFDFGDRVLRRTVADICAGHGLARAALEDDDTYPDRRDVLGQQVNVRLAAILLRIGDLLDMLQDRACPLAMNAASPLPVDSIAHWTKYRGITDVLFAPDLIRLRVECQTQDEHRFFQDWCQWLVDELNFAAAVVPRGRRHREWVPPRASLDGPARTIVITPAEGARYVPRDWKLELDQQTVFDRLVRDVYPERRAFVRELIQNALDATRCRMYDELTPGEPRPPNPTAIDRSVRERYPLRISLRWIETENELSGEPEPRQELVIEDSGIGMDEDIVTRFLLQVGRSFYTTAEFARRYAFSPVSRFGIGFLSVFAESDSVVIETLRQGQGASPLRLALTGPRQYILTERGDRHEPGTRIEARLLTPFAAGELTALITKWCRRVEVPILVTDLDDTATVQSENSDDYVGEEPELGTDGRFLIRAYPVSERGLEGEIYVFVSEHDGAENWERRAWATSTYLENHPTARVPDIPEELTCMAGIALHESRPYNSAYSFRVDIRGPVADAPSVGRRSLRLHPLSQWGGIEEALRERLIEIVGEHLRTTRLATGEFGWLYKQRLGRRFRIQDYWETLPGTIRLYRRGRAGVASVDEVSRLPEILIAPRSYREDQPPPPRSDASVDMADTAYLDRDLAELIVAGRYPMRFVQGTRRHGFVWSRAVHPTDAERLLYEMAGVAICDLPRHMIAMPAQALHDQNAAAAVNRRTPFADWLVSAVDDHLTSNTPAEPFVRLARLVASVASRPWEADRLVNYISEWREEGFSPAPPHLEITPENFRLRGAVDARV